MESTPAGFKGNKGGKGLSAYDKKPLGEKFGNKNVIEKKIKSNPKYAEVKSVIDHGKTMKDVSLISDQLIAKKKGEHFGRVKPSTLAKFLSETNNEESVFGLMKNADDKENCDTHSTVSSVASSVGGQSVSSAVTYTTEMLGITEETKFILLDLRDEDEYKKFHIREAINFPAPKITQDKVFGQLLRFKNHADKIIVIYMDDERQGTHYAKLLFEKGFDNVYLLSGGMEKFIETHHEFVEGITVPEKKVVKEKKVVTKKTSTQSVMGQSSASVMGKSTTSFRPK